MTPRRLLVLALLVATAACHRHAASSPAACVARLDTDARRLATRTLGTRRAGAGWESCDAYAAYSTAIASLSPAARAHGNALARARNTGAPLDDATRAWLASEDFVALERAALCDRFEPPASGDPGPEPLDAIRIMQAVVARGQLAETPPYERTRLGLLLALFANDTARRETVVSVAISSAVLQGAVTLLDVPGASPTLLDDDRRRWFAEARASRPGPWHVVAAAGLVNARRLREALGAHPSAADADAIGALCDRVTTWVDSIDTAVAAGRGEAPATRAQFAAREAPRPPARAGAPDLAGEYLAIGRTHDRWRDAAAQFDALAARWTGVPSP